MADFYDRVLAQVRHATPAEREDIRAELAGHVEDHAAELVELGWTEEAAADKALETMGDPEEIGRELDRKYPLTWLVLSRLPLVGIALLCAGLLLSAPFHRLYLAAGNLTARMDPVRSGFAAKEQMAGAVARELDWKLEIGNDILSIYRVSVAADGSKAAVYMCNYDQTIFGYASGTLLDHVEISGESGEQHGGSGGGGGNAGAFFWQERIPLARGDRYVRVEYDRFGEHISLDIPLDGGGEG